jgi:DNA-binding NtrC family response regulator
MLETTFFHLSAQARAVLRAASDADATLLITGSTGTGKSHLAHAIHRASARRSGGRWCKVNLATLSESLIESELFGHERGSFTGADSRRTGRLESCEGGTVFLDEIGELSPRLQAKLLDFIQYKRIAPVGSNREIELDVRIIAATNRNLEAAVKAGEFRADLFHRLNVFHVRLPDLGLDPRAVLRLAREMLTSKAMTARRPVRILSREVERVFRHYPWPGNIRELENCVEFAVAMEEARELKLESLPAGIQDYARERLSSPGSEEMVAAPTAEDSSAPRVPVGGRGDAVAFLEFAMTMDFHESKDKFEKAYLEQALRFCAGQINLTSRRIGLNKVSLTEKIKRHGIDWRRIRYESLGPHLRAVGAESASERTSSGEISVMQC